MMLLTFGQKNVIIVLFATKNTIYIKFRRKNVQKEYDSGSQRRSRGKQNGHNAHQQAAFEHVVAHGGIDACSGAL
jgi:hypothetical protein